MMDSLKCRLKNMVEFGYSELAMQNANISGQHECNIDEECDTFGFSLLSEVCADENGIINAFKKDGNWNNPGSLVLMQRAFAISDVYSSFVPQLKIGMSYVELRKAHNNMISERLFDEGKTLRNKGRFIDSCKRFDESLKYQPGFTDALLERGSVLLQLGRKPEALRDFEEVLRIQPHNHLAITELTLLRSSMCYEMSAQPTPLLPAVLSSSSARPQQVASSSSSHNRIINKLQQSLSREEIERALESSDSDSSSPRNRASSTDSSSSGSHDASTRDSKSRKRKHKKRSKKSKHSKHKSEKHEKRKKKKHRRSNSHDD